MPMLNAQSGQAFLIPQMSYIEREVYAIKYPSIRYHKLVPVDTSGGPWIPSVTYYSLDYVGQAQWFNGRAQDIANADAIRAKQETAVKMAGIGYRFDLEELAQAQMLGRNLTIDKGNAARLSAEQFIDQATIFGDPTTGFTGLVNNATVAAVPASTVGAQNGATNSPLGANKTPTQNLADVNGLLTGIWSTSNTVEMADTLLLPLGLFSYYSTAQLNSVQDTTILDFIRLKNIYTAETGQPLMIMPVRGLDTAGAGGVSRTVAYRRDPTVVKVHIPMPFHFLPTPWQVGPIQWEVPGLFRFGGVDIRRPGAFRYLDGL